MSDDFMREFLVFKVICADCGATMKMGYDRNKSGPSYSEGEPTGAAMVQNSVRVHPCDSCARPAREIKRAISTLLDAVNGGAA